MIQMAFFVCKTFVECCVRRDLHIYLVSLKFKETEYGNGKIGDDKKQW